MFKSATLNLGSFFFLLSSLNFAHCTVWQRDLCCVCAPYVIKYAVVIYIRCIPSQLEVTCFTRFFPPFHCVGCMLFGPFHVLFFALCFICVMLLCSSSSPSTSLWLYWPSTPPLPLPCCFFFLPLFHLNVPNLVRTTRCVSLQLNFCKIHNGFFFLYIVIILNHKQVIIVCELFFNNLIGKLRSCLAW